MRNQDAGTSGADETRSVTTLSFPRHLVTALTWGVIALLGHPPASAAETRQQPVACAVPTEITRLDQTLPQTSRRLAAAEPLTIVTIGSSSTAGAFASSPAASYPNRLEVELRQRFPDRAIRVVNQGVNGEDAREMVARFQQSVIAEKPDLVLWQVGTNALLLDRPIAPSGTLIRDGLNTLKAAGLDVVLIDPQFAPKVLAKADIGTLMNLYGTIAKQDMVGVFHRFEVMRYWREVAGIPFDAFLSPDELHMNDWSYGCIAKLLADAITEAATRTTVTAKVSAAPASGAGR
jgi:lysophospholipase L1-like esterase